MRLSTQISYRHSILAPKNKAFSEKFMTEYEKIFGEEAKLEIRLGGKVLQFYETNINTLEDYEGSLNWEEFFDEHLTSLLIDDDKLLTKE